MSLDASPGPHDFLSRLSSSSSSSSPLSSPPASPRSSPPSPRFNSLAKRKRPQLEIPATPWRAPTAEDEYSPRSQRLVGSFGELQLSPAIHARRESSTASTVRPDHTVKRQRQVPAACVHPGTSFKLPVDEHQQHHHPKDDEGISLQPSPPYTLTPSRRRLRSPPLHKHHPAGPENDDEGLVLEDEEEDDPPDLYDGIGFQPTPTQRYAREQKRMQQIREYKMRESREARERRTRERARRRVALSRTGGSMNNVEPSHQPPSKPSRTRMVRFSV